MSFTFQHAAQFTEVQASDPRIAKIGAAIRQYQRRQDSLIQILHLAQEIFGYLPVNVLRYIGRELKIPPSRVYGVVTFYHFFSLKPKAEHSVVVCTGTACYVKGAQSILDHLERKFGIRPGMVTPDNKVGLEQARCLGACGLAPAVVIDDKVVAKATPEEISAMIQNKVGAAS